VSAAWLRRRFPQVRLRASAPGQDPSDPAATSGLTDIEPATSTTIPLVEGGRVVVSDSAMSIHQRVGAPAIHVPVAEISSVNRGGKELVVTRRAADPIVAIAATLEDARRLDALLQSRLTRTARPAQRRWEPSGFDRADQ